MQIIDPLLAKAEAISDGGTSSMIMYLRRVKRNGWGGAVGGAE